MTIALIADGAPEHGLGHLGRSSAIAVALRARGETVSAYAYGAEEARTVDGVRWEPYASAPDARAIVLDSYTMPAADRRALAARAPLAVLHDIGELPPGTRLVLALHGAPAGTPALTGLRHAALRAPFWGVPERRVRERAERVLVTTGGALHEAGAALAGAVRAALPAAAVVALVRGPHARVPPPPGVEVVDAPPVLLDELLAADVVVTAAGQTALEAVATGAPTVAVALVDNQRRNAAALAAAGAAVTASAEEAPAAAAALAADPVRRAALARSGQAAVDGFGALRVAFQIARLA